MPAHKHAALIKAWADGTEIQFKAYEVDDWKTTDNPHWLAGYQYRVKPEPKPDVAKYYYAGKTFVEPVPFHEANFKLTFDGETGKLKAVALIN